jgi:hypothetical protein
VGIVATADPLECDAQTNGLKDCVLSVNRVDVDCPFRQRWSAAGYGRDGDPWLVGNEECEPVLLLGG